MVSFSGDAIAPLVVDSAIRTLNANTSGGHTTFTLMWVAPIDADTLASAQNYMLCASPPDPTHGSFSAVSAVLESNHCVGTIGTTSASISVPTGHAYFFNVVVSNMTATQAAYAAKGEFADPALLNYMPFEATTDDVVGA